MGYLTPILFRNDASGSIEKNPEQVMEAIKSAMRSDEDKSYAIHHYRQRKWYQFWKPKSVMTGVDCNPIEALHTRHADESSVIVFYGNTWIDLSRLIYSKWNRDNESYIEYVEDCIKLAQSHLTELKKVMKKKRESLAQ